MANAANAQASASIRDICTTSAGHAALSGERRTISGKSRRWKPVGFLWRQPGPARRNVIAAALRRLGAAIILPLPPSVAVQKSASFLPRTRHPDF
jgi:hypothetical protein